jgi:hypothetical protein
MGEAIVLGARELIVLVLVVAFLLWAVFSVTRESHK